MKETHTFEFHSRNNWNPEDFIKILQSLSKQSEVSPLWLRSVEMKTGEDELVTITFGRG